MLDAWAIIKSRQSRPEGGFGRWRLTPPGMGTPPAGGDGEFYAAARLHLIRHGFAVPPVSLRVGRFADLTRHRRVIQHREPLEGKALGVWHSAPRPSRGRLTRTCPLMI